MGKRCALFCLGGGAYVVLEFLWRGWSHISMFFAGGLCFVLIGHLGEVEFRLPLPLRVLVGVGIITMVELGTGLLFNRSYQVWDYRDQPGNFLGQICPQFCLLWLPVSWLALTLYRKAADLLE
jgi:uncharacterized membrane protein